MLNTDEVLFHPSEFDELKFQVMKYDKDAEPAEIWPILNLLPDYVEGFTWKEIHSVDDENEEARFTIRQLDRKIVFRYVCLAYDKASPIWKKFMLDPNRKKWAAYFAGWRPDEKNGYYPPEVDAMMHCQVDSVNFFVIDFLRLFNDPTFATISASIDAHFDSLKILKTSSSNAMEASRSKSANVFGLEQTKQKIREGIMKSEEDLRTVIEKWMRDRNPNLQDALYCCLDPRQNRKLNITPERRAGVPNA